MGSWMGTDGRQRPICLSLPQAVVLPAGWRLSPDLVLSYTSAGDCSHTPASWGWRVEVLESTTGLRLSVLELFSHPVLGTLTTVVKRNGLAGDGGTWPATQGLWPPLVALGVEYSSFCWLLPQCSSAPPSHFWVMGTALRHLWGIFYSSLATSPLLPSPFQCMAGRRGDLSLLPWVARLLKVGCEAPSSFSCSAAGEQALAMRHWPPAAYSGQVLAPLCRTCGWCSLVCHRCMAG